MTESYPVSASNCTIYFFPGQLQKVIAYIFLQTLIWYLSHAFLLLEITNKVGVRWQNLTGIA